MSKDLGKFFNASMRMNLYPEHVAELRDPDLKSHASKEPCKHRLREKVSQEAELEYPSQ